MYGGAAFGALMMGVVAGVQKDDYFLTVLGRLVITPLFLFSGTFFPANQYADLPPTNRLDFTVMAYN